MKTTNTLGITFYLKKCKARDGKAPIYLRITVDGRRCDVALKKDIEIKNWNNGKGIAKGKTDEIAHLNSYLEQLRSQVVVHYQDMQLKKKIITAEALKNLFCGVDEKEHSLMNLIDYHNNELGASLEPNTKKHYRTTRKFVLQFLKEKYKASDIYLSQLNYKFLIDFELFIKSDRPKRRKALSKHNSAMKYIQKLRKMVGVAIKNEWLNTDPFTKYKYSFDKTNREFLSREELKTIEAKHFSIERLQVVKDMFIFSCYTGLAYVDVSNLTPQNVSIGIDGEYWISIARHKTDQQVRIPLLPKALELINKYKNNPEVVSKGRLLPSFSNQKLNAYLKEIADLCEITKPLTFHIARHTFATTVTLTNGVPIESVSSMLGHTSIKTTQIYAKVIQQKVSQDMKLLREKMQQSSQTQNTSTHAQAV